MRRIVGVFPALLAMAVVGAVVHAAHAGDSTPVVPAPVARSVIGTGVLAHMHGRAAVNVAAGASNIQSNMAALATGREYGAVQANGLREAASPGRSMGMAASATIGPGVFAGASGLLSVNQTSGRVNVQSNTAALALGTGVEIVTDNTLGVTVSNAGVAVDPAGDGAHRHRVSISDSAFAGARGLVQVNQSAGSGNATANNFALSVKVGAQP